MQGEEDAGVLVIGSGTRNPEEDTKQRPSNSTSLSLKLLREPVDVIQKNSVWMYEVTKEWK